MLQNQPTFKNSHDLIPSAVAWLPLVLGMLCICLLANPANACNQENSLGRNAAMSEITILDNDRGKTVEAHVGDLIVIRLAENPTTGYRWEMSGVNSQLFEFQDSAYLTAPGTGIGGGGTRTFHFRVKSIGRGQIQLRYRRSWEPETSANELFTLNIRVQ